MTKRRDDGSEYLVALYATRCGRTILVSTEDYDVDSPTDEQAAFADAELPESGEISYHEEEI